MFMKLWKISMSKALLFSFVALLAATSALAIPPEPCEPVCEVCCEKPAPAPMAFAYPKDVGLSCPTDFYIFGEFLLMQAQEGGLEYAVKGGSSNINNIEGQGSNHHNWNWNPGFRVGIGGYSCHDHWNLDARWTYFRVKDTASSKGTLHPLFLDVSPATAGYAAQKWKAKINALDFRFGKPYYISRNVIWHPYFGLRGAWIDQDIDISYTNGSANEYHVDASNDFWGFGIRGGLESEWILGAGWRVIGTASGSLLFGRFDVSQDSSGLPSNDSGKVYNIHHEFYQTAPNFELGLALNWGTFFDCKRYYVNFQVGYEFQYWLVQNNLNKFTYGTDYSGVRHTYSDYLSLSGFTFRVAFDF
jgi:hypothetical protein